MSGLRAVVFLLRGAKYLIKQRSPGQSAHRGHSTEDLLPARGAAEIGFLRSLMVLLEEQVIEGNPRLRPVSGAIEPYISQLPAWSRIAWS